MLTISDIRCACRHCRFNKCLLVGMDAKGVARSANQYGERSRQHINATHYAPVPCSAPFYI